jgi:hypothetical protein
MLVFLSMHYGFSHRKFHKLHWASTLNQKHFFVTTSFSTTQFEYGVKFLMKIQIFRKIIEFLLTISSHFPSLLCSRTSIVQAWGRTHYIISDKCYVSIMLQKVLRTKRKKLRWEEKKSKKNRKNKVKKRKREKWDGNNIKVKNNNKDASRIFWLHKFSSALVQIHTQIFQPCAIR